MSRRGSSQLWVVVGPGIEAVSFADPGPALSRTLTAALRSTEDGTWYVRNAITDETYGYSVREGDGGTIRIFTTRTKGKR